MRWITHNVTQDQQDPEVIRTPEFFYAIEDIFWVQAMVFETLTMTQLAPDKVWKNK